MSTWNPSNALPDQIADAFGLLYDWFGDEDNDHLTDLENDDWATTVRADSGVTRLRDALPARGWQTPPALREFVSGGDDTTKIGRAHV